MKDGGIRKTFKLMALGRYRIDLVFTRFVLKLRGEPGYSLGGHCSGCGACCRSPMIRTYAIFFYFRSLRWLYLWWHCTINGFELIEEDRIERTFTFRCTHLVPETQQCDSYSSRPGMCRDYPRNLLYDPNPQFIDECTHCPVAENAELIEASLDELDLPSEKIDELKRKFFTRK